MDSGPRDSLLTPRTAPPKRGLLYGGLAWFAQCSWNTGLEAACGDEATPSRTPVLYRYVCKNKKRSLFECITLVSIPFLFLVLGKVGD